MILKFVRKVIPHIQYGSVIRNTAFLFGHDGDKGFDKFQRKKKQPSNIKNKHKESEAQTQDSENKSQLNQSNLNKDQNKNSSIQDDKKNSQKINQNKGDKSQDTSQKNSNIQSQGFEKSGRNHGARPKKQNETVQKIQKDSINNQTNKIGQGFGRFSRNKQQKTPNNQDKNTKVSQPVNQQKITQQKVNQKKNQFKQDQQIQQNNQAAAGFAKFKRQKIPDHKQQIKTQNVKQQKFQQKKPEEKNKDISKQIPGFTKFGRKKPSDIIDNTNSTNVNAQQQQKKSFQQKKEEDNKKAEESHSQYKAETQKTEQKQKNQSTGKSTGFQKFHNRQKEDPQKIKKKVENTFASQSQKNPPPQQPIQKKSAQQLLGEKLQKQLKQKERFFKEKIFMFKQKKKNEQSFQKSLMIHNLIRKFEQKFFEKTGIDLNAKIQPPSFVKSSPILFAVFKILSNMKLFLLMMLLFYAFYAIRVSIGQFIPLINPQNFLNYIQRGQANRIIFEEKQFQTDTDIGKKSRYYTIIILKNGQQYKCVSNPQFERVIRNIVDNQRIVNPNEIPILIQNRKKLDSNFFGIMRSFLSILMLYIFISSIMGASKAGRKGAGGGKSLNLMQQSKSKRFQQKISVKFGDVVGMQKAKEQVVQFIDFLQNPQKYHKLGAKIPKGALLTGPPGTGKTMIAKACAGQSKVPFFTISGSQFMQMYVGVGAQRVRDLFKQAKQAAPSIIFIDEIDAVGKKRAAGFGGGNDQRDNTLNQLLVQMDGFNTNSNVIVFAATNQKDVLDPALTRPGRFDRLIQVDLPDLEGRRQIFMVHLKPIVIDSQKSMDQYARRMATLTPGFSGADIKNLCNQAAIMAARNQNKFVTMHDFQLATERIIGGVQKKSHLITQQTRKIVAYHQCGHGVVSWFLQGANPLLKLTIIPRSKGSIGFAQYLPHQTQITTKKQLYDQICVILSGRITEEIFFNRISTGAYDDLQKAYNIANKIVTQYGMSKRLGWLSFQESEYAKYYSKQTQRVIDQEIMNIIKQCTEKSKKIILEKKDLIQKLATKLLEVETIDLSTISEILGQRPFKGNKQYEEYLLQHKKMVEQNVKAASFKESKKQITKFSDYIV